MADKFDPLHKWLGIHPKDQPPTYYRLLGLDLFESDAEVIEAAATRVTTFVEGCVEGPHGEQAQKLLKVVAGVRRCLVDPQARAAYDVKLRGPRAAAGPTPSPPKVTKTAPTPPPPPAATRAQHAPPAAGQPAGVRVAKPIAAPPPPPPPPAPAPPPAEVAESGESDWGLGEIEPVSFSRKRPAKGSSAKATAKQERQAPKQAADEAKEKASTRGRKKSNGPRNALLGFIALGGIVVVAVVLISVFGSGNASAGKDKDLAQSSEGDTSETDATAANTAETGDQATESAAAKDAAVLADGKAAKGAALANATADVAVDASAKQKKASPAENAPDASADSAAAEPLLKLARDGGPIAQLTELLAGGADVETADSAGRSLLRLAVMGGHADLIDALLEKKAKAESVDVLGETPLMSAAQQGNESLVSKLLTAGAKPNSRSRVAPVELTGGMTALLVAVRHGHADVVKLLLEQGANPNVASGRGITPLMIACWQGQGPIVQGLIHKAKIDAVDSEGQTALMYAVENGNEAILKQMLSNEAIRVSTKSKTGATALGIALARRSAPIAQMLREAMKNEAPMLDF